MLFAITTLASGWAQWIALFFVAGVLVVSFVPLWLLVEAFGAVVELPSTLGVIASRHEAPARRLVTHVRGREGRALRSLAIREAIPVLRSATEVRGATAAAIALTRFNPLFLALCALAFSFQVAVLFLGLPLAALGLAT